MFHCPVGFCLFNRADWNVWAEHVRGHGRIVCSVAGCTHVFKEQRVYRRHFTRAHTDDGRYRCSACTTVYTSKQTAVKHCKKCKKNGKAVPVDVAEGDDAVEDDAAEDAVADAVDGGGAVDEAVGGDAEVEEPNVDEEVSAALAFYRAPLVVPVSPLREEPFVPPIVRVDVHLLAVVQNGRLVCLYFRRSNLNYVCFSVYLDLSDEDLIVAVGRDRLERIGRMLIDGKYFIFVYFLLYFF